MDYFVGGVAALISGNVTPNRPRLVKKALTPVKHQTSPNVTPKSALIDDKSVFLSPTLQRKKAIVKKSPKRIFEDSDINADGELVIKSPKADKVKKHLTEDLDAGDYSHVSEMKILKLEHGSESSISATKLKKSEEDPDQNQTVVIKNKNSRNMPLIKESMTCGDKNNTQTLSKKKKTKNKSSDSPGKEILEIKNDVDNTEKIMRSRKKSKSIKKGENEVSFDRKVEKHTNEKIENTTKLKTKKKKKKKQMQEKNKVSFDGKGKKHTNEKVENTTELITKENRKQKRIQENYKSSIVDIGLKNKNKEIYVNPNAISHEDTESEHDSDNEIESENEENMKHNVTEDPEQSSDDEEMYDKKQKKRSLKPKKEEEPEHQPNTDEINRTIFVGNVPFSKKCKKEIKKIFSKHGAIESVRIRAVPVKDAQTSKKLAVIKSELHPSRTTVNVYVKFREESSVEKALSENNTVLGDCHLRVNRSDTTGAHDPRRALFVGNLPFAIEDETLRAKFEKCGEVVSVRVIRDKKTNVGKGFGYVNFASKDGVELALLLSEEDLTIKNRVLRVKRCTTGDSRKQINVGNKRFSKNQQPKKNEKQANDKIQGAYRRIMNKRKNEGGNADGPPNKKYKGIEQPIKNKKQRKEYLGVTAEKKKKKSFAKGQRKKKLISELLTK